MFLWLCAFIACAGAAEDPAMAAFLAGDFHTARQAFQDRVAANPTDVEALFNLGVVQYTQDDNFAAAESLREAVRLDDSSPDARLYLGLVLSEMGRAGVVEVGADGTAPTALLDDAVVQLSKAVTMVPTVAEAHFQLGLALHSRGLLLNSIGKQVASASDVGRAIARYRATVQMEDDRHEAWAYLGAALRDAATLTASTTGEHQEEVDGFHADAVDALRHAVSLAPEEPQYQSSLGLALVDVGDLHGAVDAFRATTELMPEDASVWLNLGSALHQLGLPEEASLALYTATGEAAAEASEDPAADPAFAKRATVSDDRTRANAYFGLGLALKDLGQLKFAGRAYQSAVELDPSNEDAAVQLVWTLLQQDEVGAAAKALQAASAQHPSRTWWPYTSSIRAHLGLREPVASTFRDLLQSPSTQPDADPTLRPAVVASSLLKHTVCSPLDLVLNDKARCGKALQDAHKKYPEVGFEAVHPTTFFLPAGAKHAKAAASVAPAGTRWVTKPSWGANGAGVKFLDPFSDLEGDGNPNNTLGWIVQRYVDPPTLLDGHKFDLRVFVTVHSVQPLIVLVHSHGWANVANSPYRDNVPSSHVTNAALLEHLPLSKRACRKFSLKHVFGRLVKSMGKPAAAKVWADIQAAAMRTVVAGLLFDGAFNATTRPFCAFKTFGFDFIVDDRHMVHMIEVNRNPGFDYDGRKACEQPPMDYALFAVTLASLAALDAPGRLPSPAQTEALKACAVDAAGMDVDDRFLDQVVDAKRMVGHLSAGGPPSSAHMVFPALQPRVQLPGDVTRKAPCTVAAGDPVSEFVEALSPLDAAFGRVLSACVCAQ